MAKYVLYGITGVTLVWLVVALGFAPLLAFLTGCSTLISTLFSCRPEITRLSATR